MNTATPSNTDDGGIPIYSLETIKLAINFVQTVSGARETRRSRADAAPRGQDLKRFAREMFMAYLESTYE